MVPPATIGGPSQTIPCDYFLKFAYSYGHSQKSSFISLKSTPSHSSPSPAPTAPATLKYKDPKLTGCYAGTGGSTTFTLTSGDQLGIPDSPGFVNIGIEPQTFNFSCAKFFHLDLPWHIISSFAESPACASYAQEPIDQYVSIAGVQNGDAHIPFKCCGGCKFFASEVEVLYWPTSSSADCSRHNATITPHATPISLLSHGWTSAYSTALHAPEIAVVDGSSLTFPSLYLAIHGAISVQDSCGIKGKTHYNPTIAIPPGGLSTLSYPSNLIQYAGEAPQTGIYDPAACRTYGLSNGSTTSYLYGHGNTSTWTTTVSYSMGPPYNPILLPPDQLTALDPEWQACTSWDLYGDNAYDVFFGLYDPPRVLTPASAIVGSSTTSPGSPPSSSSPAPQPASTPSPVDPGVTTVPKPTTEINSLPSSSLLPASSVDDFASIIMLPFGQRPTQSKSKNMQNTETTVVDSMDPQSISDQHSTNEALEPAALPFTNGEIASTTMLPATPPFVKASVLSLNPAGSSQPILTIAGKTYIMDPASDYIVGSHSLSLGASAIKVDGTAYSLASPMTLRPAESEVVSVLPISSGQGVTIDGSTYTPNAEGQYMVATQTLSPGGSTIKVNDVPYVFASAAKSSLYIQETPTSALTINNPVLTIDGNLYTANTVSNDLLGSLKFISAGPTTTANSLPDAISSSVTTTNSDGRTINLYPQDTVVPAQVSTGSDEDAASTVYTVDGIQLEGNPTALAVGSTTLKQGSPPLVVSSHTLSLATGGAVIVDGASSSLILKGSSASSTSASDGSSTSSSLRSAGHAKSHDKGLLVLIVAALMGFVI